MAVVRAGAAVVSVGRFTLARSFLIKPILRRLPKKVGKVSKSLLRETVVVGLFDKFIGGKVAALPTTAAATAALLKGIEAQKSIGRISIVKRSGAAITAIKGAGLTALIPELRRAVAKNVAEGLGVPKWVIFTAAVVFA